MKALRITLLTLLGIVVIVVAAAAIFVATFDANRYKPEIEKLVLDRTGRTLKIEGNIKLTLFPNIGAETGRATLSEKDKQQAFVTIDSIKLSVALLPLLSGQILVDGVKIDGLGANITRDKAGAFNFADLMGANSTTTQSPSSAAAETKTNQFEFDITSIALTKARLSYVDLQSGMDLQVSDLNLQTGRIAPESSGALELSAAAQSKSLELNVKLIAKSDYKLDLAKQKVDLSKLSAKVTGNWQDFKNIDSTLAVNLLTDIHANAFTLNELTTHLKAQLANQTLELTAKTRQAQMTKTVLSVEASEAKLSIKGKDSHTNADLKLPAFQLADGKLNLSKLTANASVSNPALGKEPLTIATTGDLSLNTKTENLVTELSGQLDGSPMKLGMNVAGFAKPAVTFDLALDQLKLDRFGVASKTADSTADSGTNAGVAKAGVANTSNSPAPIGLSALKGHNIKGKLQVGKVLSKGVSVYQVQADVALNQGKLSVAPHSAQMFGGKLAGSLTVDANTNEFALQENITSIKLQTLLAALGQEPRVTGDGALALDLKSAGSTVKSLEQNLAGKVSVNLKDGAIKGIDIGAIINNVRTMLGKAPAQQGAGSGQTAFTELTASATIQRGIATNRDLNVKAPLFRLEGAGTINIPQSSLDYLAKVAVVESSTGQGGKDLAALKGLTIPIKISGKFDSPQYSVDMGSLAAELAKSQLGDKAKEEINKVVPGLGDALKGLFGR
jgi:AsmA protein